MDLKCSVSDCRMVPLFYIVQNALLYHPYKPCKCIFFIHTLLADLLNHRSSIKQKSLHIRSRQQFHLIISLCKWKRNSGIMDLNQFISTHLYWSSKALRFFFITKRRARYSEVMTLAVMFKGLMIKKHIMCTTLSSFVHFWKHNVEKLHDIISSFFLTFAGTQRCRGQRSHGQKGFWLFLNLSLFRVDKRDRNVEVIPLLNFLVDSNSNFLFNVFFTSVVVLMKHECLKLPFIAQWIIRITCQMDQTCIVK